MPTYSYKCDACSHRFEQLQSMMDEPLTVCPNCGEQQVRRLIGAGAGLIFKGSGFYITDYARKPKQENGKSKESPDKKPKGKPEPAAGNEPGKGKASKEES